MTDNYVSLKVNPGSPHGPEVTFLHHTMVTLVRTIETRNQLIE